MSVKATRSPNSPSKALGNCFDDAMKLYDAFPHASFDNNQIASVLKRSSGSGGFKSLLSDLKQYGLIERNSSGEFTVSQALKEISMADASGKDALKYSFAIRPSVFTQILEDQGYHLPDVSTLANVLIARFGFNREKAAKTAKALRESLEWANAIDNKGNVLPPKQNNPTGIAQATPPDTLLDKEAKGIADGQSIAHDENEVLSADIPIKDGRVVHIRYPQDLTTNEAKKVGAVLSALTQ